MAALPETAPIRDSRSRRLTVSRSFDIVPHYPRFRPASHQIQVSGHRLRIRPAAIEFGSAALNPVRDATLHDFAAVDQACLKRRQERFAPSCNTMKINGFLVRRMARKLRVTLCGEEIHRTGPGDEIGSQASRRARLTTTLPAFHVRLLSGLSDMSDANARSDGNSGTGVLELLRLFKGDAAAADQYAITQLGKTRTVEPVLKAFEYLPLDVARKPGPLSGIPVGIKDIIATANMPTTNGSPI